MIFDLEKYLNPWKLSVCISIGQYIVIFYVLVLNIYIDDYREIARKEAHKKNQKEKVFSDWFNANVIWPLIMGSFFVLSSIMATEITHDLKEKVRNAEAAYSSQQKTIEKVYGETGK